MLKKHVNEHFKNVLNLKTGEAVGHSGGIDVKKKDKKREKKKQKKKKTSGFPCCLSTAISNL